MGGRGHGIVSQTQDRIRELQRQIRDLRALLAKQAQAITALNNKTRRGTGNTTFAAAATQTIDIVWSSPFPDDQYGVWVTLYTTNPAQVHQVPSLASKTAGGITVTVVAASGVGNVIADVLAERTT